VASGAGGLESGSRSRRGKTIAFRDAWGDDPREFEGRIENNAELKNHTSGGAPLESKDSRPLYNVGLRRGEKRIGGAFGSAESKCSTE